MIRIPLKLSYQFGFIAPTDKIMLFASYPVGFPVLKTLASAYPKNLEVVTHHTPGEKKLTNQVDIFCRENHLRFYTPIRKNISTEEKKKQWKQFENDVLENGRGKWPELGIVCSYGHMIPGHIISKFRKGAFLAHPSLTPKYKGGSPIFHAIANGQKQSGVSYMSISPDKFDEGDILYQVTHQLGECDSYEKVQKDLSELAAKHILQVIDSLDKLRPGTNQSEINVQNIPKHQLTAPVYKDKKLDLAKPAEEVYNWSRALITPRVKFNGEELIIKFQRNFIEDEEGKYSLGQIVLVGKKKIFLKCSDKLIQLSEWQQVTKKSLPIHFFINRFITNRKEYDNTLFFQ